MKKEKHSEKIQKIVVVKKGVTAEENRYIDKKTREILGLQIPRRPKKLPDYLNAAEISHILEVSSEKPFNALLIRFLIMTGLRISEANNVLVQDIDFGNNQIKVVAGKGEKDRHVPITIGLKTQIRTYLVKRNKGYLFCKKNGTQPTIRALQIRIKRIVNKCGFTKNISAHSLRHTYACLLLSKGMRLEDIKLIMGHDSIKTTEIYAKLELGSIKEKYQQLMGVD